MNPSDYIRTRARQVNRYIVTSRGDVSGQQVSCCHQEPRMVVSPKSMAGEFKVVRFFVMIGAAAFVVCAVTMFYTQRATYGRTAPERAAYAIGEKAGEEAPANAKLPTDADLNMMAQKYFKQQSSGEQQSWDLAFANGHTDGFKKTHHRE
jgi:hypothetical protein